MIQSELVSAVIPAYNSAQYIGQAIDSVLNQNYINWELVIVNDGSTDSTEAIVAQYRDPRIRLINQENQGLAGARNTGITAAKGELVGLLDADDQWLPSYLEHMCKLANNHKEAVVFYCQAKCMNEEGEDLPQILGGFSYSSLELYWKLLRANFIIPSTTLICRGALMDAGLFDASLRSCEDWDLWLRFLPEREIVGVEECLVRYRIHGSSLSTDIAGMLVATRAVMKKHFGKEDGRPDTWSEEKRRAYGGVYRYHLLTFIQRQNDWQAGAEYLERALIIDPTLSMDVDLFYDLALGSQPPGYRGTAQYLSLEANESNIRGLLQDVFSSPTAHMFSRIRKQTYGTAYYALGLLAYNSKEKSLSRTYLSRALRYRPDLWRNSLVISDIFKSLLPQGLVDTAKSIIGRS